MAISEVGSNQQLPFTADSPPKTGPLAIASLLGNLAEASPSKPCPAESKSPLMLQLFAFGKASQEYARFFSCPSNDSSYPSVSDYLKSNIVAYSLTMAVGCFTFLPFSIMLVEFKVMYGGLDDVWLFPNLMKFNEPFRSKK